VCCSVCDFTGAARHLPHPHTLVHTISRQLCSEPRQKCPRGVKVGLILIPLFFLCHPLYLTIEIRLLFVGIHHSAGWNPSIKHYINAIRTKPSTLNARKPLVGGREPHLCSQPFGLELRPFRPRACRDLSWTCPDM